MIEKSERQAEAEKMGLLPFRDLTPDISQPDVSVVSTYPVFLSGYGEYTPITVRSSSIPLNANLE
jgi:hypothetical protein